MSGQNYQICEKIIESLNSSELLRDYSLRLFNKTPKFFLGIDANKPPITNDAPFVMVVPDTSSFSEYVAEMNSIFIGCVISDSTASTVGNITKIQGYQTLEEFERIVCDNIDNLFQEFVSRYSIMEKGDVRYLAYYPEFHSQRNYKILSEKE